MKKPYENTVGTSPARMRGMARGQQAYSNRPAGQKREMKNRKKRAIMVLFPLLALVLELLPCGVVLWFGNLQENGAVEMARSTYSYFAPGPIGYANFGPLITAWATVLLLAVSCVYWFKGKGRWSIAALSIGSAALSLLPLLMFGPDYFSAVGGLITSALAAQAVLVWIVGRKK